jgi:AraC-like DNA-binding protein
MASYRHIVTLYLVHRAVFVQSAKVFAMPLTHQSVVSRFVPAIHPSYARLLCAHLQGLGIDLAKVFEGSTLTWDALLERQRFISFEQFSHIGIQGMQLSGRPWLGLDISSIIQVSSHGPLGYGALASRDVRQAFKLVERMMPTRIELYTFELEEIDERAYFRLHENAETGELREFIQVMLLGSFIDMLSKISSTKVEGLIVEFPFPEPPWAERYIERFEGIEVFFGRPGFLVDMPRSFLDQPCLTADEYAYRNAVRECETLLERQQKGGELADTITRELLVVDDGEYPTLEEMAERHHMSSRTLIRKLKTESTNYQTLLDEVRKELACWRILNTDESIEHIAETLGFVDTSNFSRVFRRWLNCTPSEFKTRRSGTKS